MHVKALPEGRAFCFLVPVFKPFPRGAAWSRGGVCWLPGAARALGQQGIPADLSNSTAFVLFCAKFSPREPKC